jgi:hypothetical protein
MKILKPTGFLLYARLCPFCGKARGEMRFNRPRLIPRAFARNAERPDLSERATRMHSGRRMEGTDRRSGSTRISPAKAWFAAAELWFLWTQTICSSQR